MDRWTSQTVVVGLLLLVVVGGSLLTVSIWALTLGEYVWGIVGIAAFIPNAFVMVNGLREELS